MMAKDEMRISDQVVNRLLEIIQTGGLQAGERLPAERKLAEQLGVSRSSLREAIQQLVSRGVLYSRLGAGTYLQSPSAQWPQRAIEPLAALMLSDPHYRYDVLEARQALETSTVWHAAQRATAEDKERIRRCFDTMVQYQQGHDAEHAARADAQFHLAIAEASHNLVLLQVMRGLFELVLGTVTENRHLMFVHDDPPQTLERLTRQHEALMQSILAGDPEQARAVMGEHLDYVRATLAQADENEARFQRSSRLPSSRLSLDKRLP